MTTWNPPTDLSEEGKAFIRKDMAFATAVSALEDLKAAYESYKRYPHYLRERDGLLDLLGNAMQVADHNVDEAFGPFVGNIVMTGVKNAYEQLRNEDEEDQDYDDQIALIRAARVIFGTW